MFRLYHNNGLLDAGHCFSESVLNWPLVTRLVSTLLLMTGFCLSLFVHYQSSVYLVPATMFWIAGCFILLFTGKHQLDNGLLPWVVIGWLSWLLLLALLLKVTPFSYFLMHLFACAPLYVLATMREDRATLLRWHLATLMFVCGILALLAIIESVTTGKPAETIFWNRNNLAALLNIGFIVSLGWLIRQPSLDRCFLNVLFITAVLATGSRGGFAAAFICTGLLIAFTTKNRCWLLLPAVMSITGLLSLNHSVEKTLGVRWQIWQTTVDMMQQGWSGITGAGLGMFRTYYEPVRVEMNTQGNYVHNDALHLLYETGWLGLLFFYGTALAVLLRFRTSAFVPLLAMAAVFIHTHISFHFYILPIQMALAVMLAWYLELTRKQARS